VGIWVGVHVGYIYSVLVAVTVGVRVRVGVRVWVGVRVRVGICVNVGGRVGVIQVLPEVSVGHPRL